MATRFSDPANVPMGSNRLSPIDQASSIKLDTGLVTGDVTLDNYSQPLRLGTSLNSLQTAARNALAADSDAGRYGVAGIGDLGQFAGGFGNSGGTGGKYFDDQSMATMAFANGGEAQAPAANPFADPNTMAVYDQMRQTVSPKEFGDEMFAGASQVDPEAMAQFRNELSQIDLSPEELDMLNNMVDEILANPEQYAAVRAKYLEMGAPEELLPEQFDPQFFAAMNMAVDQLIGEPAGVQAFAQGGIAELKPIAKAIASYGRNGDTMLAHITPAEARMLRRRGGSGTINPSTGLPEFFLKKAFKSLGKVVKNFAKSKIGRVITAVAIGFFLGPAAVAAFGATAGTVAAAAITGFTASAGSSLLAGDGLKQALKQGVTGAITAGAVQGVGSAVSPGFSLTGQAPASGVNPTAMEALTGQYNKVFGPSATASGIQAPTLSNQNLAPVDASFTNQLNVPGPDFAPVSGAGSGAPGTSMFGSNPSVQFDTNTLPNFNTASPVTTATRGVGNTGAYQPRTIGESFSKMGEGLGMGDGPASFDTFKEGATNLFSPGPTDAQITTRAREIMSTTPGTSLKDAMTLASSDLGAPGFLRTYGPATVAGLGAVGLAGGFKATDAEPSEMRNELMKPVTQRIAEGGNQRNFYIQGLPGVKYDQYGAPIFGQNVPLPTFDTGLGVQSLINPRGFAAGGAVTAANFDETAYLNANPDVKAELARLEGRGSFKNAYEHFVQYGQAEGRTAFDRAETAAAAAADAAAKEAAQAANRKVVADAKAAKKAAGFGDAYKNINAGLSYDVPAGIAATSIAARQAAFAPKLSELQNSMMGNSLTLATPETQTYLSKNPDVMQAFKASNYGMSPDQYAQAHYQKFGKKEGRTMPVRAPVTQPYNNASGYGNAINNPVLPAVNYNTTPVVTTQPSAEKKLMNMGGIASLRSGGYPRKTGQINGPGTATSDSIPAMLSDGEFVMTAKAVRGAGKGDRRAGAKRMYALMNQLEKNAARG